MVNPNDPSENPEAFSSHASPMRAGSGSDPSNLNPSQNQRDREEGVRTSRDHAHLSEHVKRQSRTSGTPDRSPLHPGRTKVKATSRGDDMVYFIYISTILHILCIVSFLHLANLE